MAEQSLDSLLDVSGVGESTLDDIRNAGYETVNDLVGADRIELREISGVGSATADNIIRFLDEKGLRERDELTENQRKFQSLLHELFQFDAADLDFGIYRIMNQKREEIDQFIEEDLIEAVHEGLSEVAAVDQSEFENELEQKRQTVINTVGADALTEEGEIKDEYCEMEIPAVQEAIDDYIEVRDKLDAVAIGEDMEASIFNDLYRFFGRYFEDGDFVPKRRYSKDNKYAVPYNGEETHFYWANQNQYYIKTSEHFSNYQFRSGSLTVSFEIRDAHLETDNRKEDADRYFVLFQTDPVRYDPDEKELTVLFEYRALTEEDFDRYDTSGQAHNKQADIRADIADHVVQEVPEKTANRLTQQSRGRETRLLSHHLREYTTRNTRDYFIHKNLGEFLEQELEFYIKNEVVDLDTVLEDSKQAANRAAVVKSIGTDIIQFLSQIEDFQRKLFEKQKFVTSSEYCLTLDKIPERLYQQILENEDQIAEWEALYQFNQGDDDGLGRFQQETEFGIEFLQNNQSMMVDTQFFDTPFKHKLLASIDDVEDEMDGVLIKGENYQALNLLMEKYQGKIQSIYIDPPYNTGNKFVYKDNYQHSSWLSMMENRLSKARRLLDDDGLFFSSIDDNELNNYAHLLNDTFGEQVNLVVVRNNPKGRGLDQYLAKSHDYLLSYAKESVDLAGIPKSDEQIAEQYGQKDEHGRYRRQPLRNTHREFNRKTRKNLWYPLYVDPDTNEVYLEESDERIEVYPVWDDGHEGCWTWNEEKAAENRELLVGRQSSGRWQVYRKDYAREDGDPATYTPKTIWDDNDMRTDHAQRLLDDIMGDEVFRAPKPPALIKRAIQLSTAEGEYILDFFAGSGTTAQAVIELNRERNMDQDYILVDLGEHLTDVAKPRIQRLVYTKDWEEGTPQNTDGISHMFKYQEIESYEDSLDNISFTEESQTALDTFDDYFLEYMLEFESRDCATRLDIDELSKPFNYKLRLVRDGERNKETVNLVETFNYLIGLDVSSITTYEHQNRQYRVVRGLKDDDTVVVIWRNTDGLDLGSEATFVEESITTGDEDIIYMNGDSVVGDAQSLEEIFKNRMEA